MKKLILITMLCLGMIVPSIGQEAPSKEYKTNYDQVMARTD